MYQGRYVFSQIVDFIPRYEFQKCVDEYNGDLKVRKFKCWDQFLVMIFAQVTCRESIRSTIVCLKAHKSKLYHLGLESEFTRKTVVNANCNRNWRIYRDFAQILISEARVLYTGDDDLQSKLDGIAYALDSTTIDLCLTSFSWAKFRKKKGAVKVHTLMAIDGSIPTFIHITDGKFHDVKVLDILDIEVGAYYVMDKAYIDYERLHRIETEKAFFITRAKRNIRYKRIYSSKISNKNKNKGIRCDQTIRLTGIYTSKRYPDKLRRIKYYDKEQGKYYVFLTNNFLLDPILIAELYKARWKIELLFRWIKQNLEIKVFWGRSENAVKTQIWIAVCVYLTVAIMKKKLNLKQSLHEILQILSVSTLNKDGLHDLFYEDCLQFTNPSFQNSLF